MRITTEQIGDSYLRVMFHHDNTIVMTKLLNTTECIVLAESLRNGAESIEHYSRVIQSEDKNSEHNVVLEYDSKYHRKLSQKNKDLQRQQRIISILNPKKFWSWKRSLPPVNCQMSIVKVPLFQKSYRHF